MLKIAGSILILFGAGGYGSCLCNYLKQHLKQLLTFRDIFVQMDSGRECLRLPYSQLLRRTATGKSKLFSEILLQIAEEMEKNREADVGILWTEALEERKKEILLKEEELSLIITLGKNIAYEGKSTKVCEIYFMQLEDKIVQAMDEKKEKQKLYGSVSLLGGLFLVILLL